MFSAPHFARLADTPDAAVGAGRNGAAAGRGGLGEYVAREVELLLNTPGTLAADELERFVELQGSVLNYGMPSLTGLAASAVNTGAGAERIRAAISSFEPRLRDVRVLAQPLDPVRPELRFQVRGVLPLGDNQAPVMLETQIGLGTGDVRVSSGG